MASFIPSFRDFVQPDIINATPSTIIKTTNDPLNTASIPVVYGLQRLVPPRIFTRISDQDPNTLVCVYALSMGECLGIYRLFVDDHYVPTQTAMALNESNLVSGSTNRTIVEPATDNTYYGVSQFEFIAGNEKYIYDTYSTDGYQSKLLAQHITNPSDRPSYGADLCLLVTTFTYNSDGNSPYNSIPLITVDLFGRRVNASITNPDVSTYRSYTTNPVECLFDYLTNSNFGCGLTAAQLDCWASGTSFDTARDYCNVTEITQVDDGTSISNDRYTMNAIINTGADRAQNVLKILKSYLMMMPFIDGKFQIHMESQGSPEVTINEDSLVDSFRITYPESNTRYTDIAYSYIEPQIGFGVVRGTYPKLTSTEYTTYVSEDNGNRNTLNLDLTSITNVYQAERIAKSYLLKSRLQAKYEFTVIKDFFKYRVGDIVNFTTSTPSLSAVPIRIVKMTLQDNDLIKVEAYSHSNSFYTSFPDFTTQKPVYTQPLIPTEGGVTQPGDSDIGINPPGTGDSNPTPTPVTPAPIVPSPSPTPTPVPDYAYNVDVSIDTIGGAYDVYPYRFYVGGIYTNQVEAGLAKADATYVPQIVATEKNGIVHTRFTNHAYELYLCLVDRTAPDNQPLAMVYELPNGRYGICRKEQNTLIPTFYYWDPETPKDYVDVVNEVTGSTRLESWSEFRNNYLLVMERDTSRNTSFPVLSKEGFYNFPLASRPLIFPTDGPFNTTHNDIMRQRLIRQWLNPMFAPRKNFIISSTSYTFNFKLFNPVSKQYFGSGSVDIGPDEIPSSRISTSRYEYEVATYVGYPSIPF